MFAARSEMVNCPISCAGRYTIVVVIGTFCFRTVAIACQDTAHHEDEPAQAVLAKAAEDAGESSKSTSAASGADTQTANQSDVKKEETQASGAASSPKQGEWLLAPIPVMSPAIGSGL